MARLGATTVLEALTRALADLTPREQAIVAGRMQEDSFETIAAAQSLDVVDVRRSYYRLIKKLRHRLEAYLPGVLPGDEGSAG